MFMISPITSRVQGLRQTYRETIPTLDMERVRLLTEFSQNNTNDVPILHRAKALRAILSEMTVRVEPGELLVGNMSKTYRGCCLWPEYGGLNWLVDELDSGVFDRRQIDEARMTMDQADRQYAHDVADYWQKESLASKLAGVLPEEIHALGTTGVSHDPFSNGSGPSGHYNANFRKAIDKGFGAIKQDALDRLEQMKGKIFGKDADSYFFYQAIVISCDSAILFSKRYAKECRVQAARETDESRKTELTQMADSLEWIMENPARTFHEALQVCLLYMYILMIEGNYLGLAVGRLDQHVGDYLEADLKAGRITQENAQELMDCYFLKMANLFFPGPSMMSRIVGAYSNNLRITIGGRTKDGQDATNKATYMCLQSSARLKLHDPNLSLGVHADTPEALLEGAIETSRVVNGIPCIENADLIIDLLHKRGLAIEDARNYCVIGCTELSGSGCEWSNVSSPFSKGFININNILIQAINNGINPQNGQQGGLQTGYLYEKETFEHVLSAVEQQFTYFMDWHVSINTILETVGFPLMPVPIASATMDGCMESGTDMMVGGATYNSTGTAILGVGTIVDSLSAIKYMVFDKQLCSAIDLYDAIMANWEGYELLRQRIVNEVPHYGNGDPYADELATWVADLYTTRANAYQSPRGGHRAGIYSAGAHIIQGYMTSATPDGRQNGQPLSDSASPSHGVVKNGPTGIAKSVLALNPSNFGNGLQFNFKFHPSTFDSEQGNEKMRQFINAFFDQGGMQLQYNVVDSQTLRRAQADPDEYKDLVVRVAGFSAYFVELHQELQDDLIARSEVKV